MTAPSPALWEALHEALRAAAAAGVSEVRAYSTRYADQAVLLGDPGPTGIILHISQAPRYLAGVVAYHAPTPGHEPASWLALLEKMAALGELVPEDWQ